MKNKSTFYFLPFTFTTCIENQLNQEQKQYLFDYLEDYNIVLHRIINIANLSLPEIQNKLNKELVQQKSFNSRQANALIREAAGIQKSYFELKKYEAQQISFKIEFIKEKIHKHKLALIDLNHKIKKLVQFFNSKDKLKNLNLFYKNKKKLIRLTKKRNKTKQIKHLQCLKLNKFNQDLVKLNKQIHKRKMNYCFGTKNLFKSQFRLRVEESLNSNLTKKSKKITKKLKKWLNKWREKRVSHCQFIGRTAERQGNSIAQLTCLLDKENSFALKLRVSPKFETIYGKYIYINNIKFDSKMLNEVKEIIQLANKNKIAINIRILNKKSRFYLQVFVEKNIEENKEKLEKTEKVLGFDFNQGFIQACQVKIKDGNITKFIKEIYEYKNNKKQKSSLNKAINNLINYAKKEKINYIFIENLNFKKIKAKQTKNKKFNKMINQFAYSQYQEKLDRECKINKINLIKVSPYLTSRIGKQKYNKIKGINTHMSASYVIARRGLGFKDNLKA